MPGHARDGHLPAGEIVDEDLDLGAHAGRDVALDEGGGSLDAFELRLGEGPDVELQGLRLHDEGAHGRHADFARGGDGSPRSLIQVTS